jgi:hypothetical protein
MMPDEPEAVTPPVGAIPTLADDPCGRAVALKAKRDEIAFGDGVAEIDMEHGNGVPRLDKEIAAADQACDRKNGKRPARRVVAARGVW